MNFFHHKDLGNRLLQLCPKVVKHPVYSGSLGSGLEQLTVWRYTKQLQVTDVKFHGAEYFRSCQSLTCPKSLPPYTQPKIRYCVHSTLTPDPIPSHLHPPPNLAPDFLNVNFNIILPLTTEPPTNRLFPLQNFWLNILIHCSYLPYILHAQLIPSSSIRSR